MWCVVKLVLVTHLILRVFDNSFKGCFQQQSRVKVERGLQCVIFPGLSCAWQGAGSSSKVDGHALPSHIAEGKESWAGKAAGRKRPGQMVKLTFPYHRQHSGWKFLFLVGD